MASANASPTKDFFVRMLTRDISIEDTIFDLIDNCHDGLLRTTALPTARERLATYGSFWARLTIEEDWFSIEDNCGGIPITLAETEAFRMGRPLGDRDKDLGTVGIYGIGMKRALFKIGREAVVTSRYTELDEFEVVIPADWRDNDEDWTFEMRPVEPPNLAERGTRIMVTSLNAEVREAFTRISFLEDLQKQIGQTYALIMRQGFKIFLNDIQIDPSEVQIFVPSTEESIGPYALQGVIDGVEVALACGLYRPLANVTEIDDEQESRRTKNDAGWTVICNDRVILYQDRSHLTGWGAGVVPSFHNQFIAIAGVVIFRSKDAAKLPLTTTKRGIDVGSFVYAKALDYMMKATKIFTDFTNQWKGSEEDLAPFFKRSTKITASDVPARVSAMMREVARSGGSLRQLSPELPRRERLVLTRRIVFTRPVSSIEKVSEFLLGVVEKPSVVGEACFDAIEGQSRS